MDNCRVRHVCTSKCERKPGILINYCKKILISRVGRKRSLELNTETLKRLCCFDKVTLKRCKKFWFQFSTDRTVRNNALNVINSKGKIFRADKMSKPGDTWMAQ